jgi:hypothetical protein
MFNAVVWARAGKVEGIHHKTTWGTGQAAWAQPSDVGAAEYQAKVNDHAPIIPAQTPTLRRT